jgi:hypothetical protein
MVMAMALFSMAAMAQDKTTGDKAQQSQMHQPKDYIMMKDGKMWMMKDGANSAIDKDITLSNGTKVTASGQVTAQDGKSMMMHNGDMIDLNGVMMADRKKSKM